MSPIDPWLIPEADDAVRPPRALPRAYLTAVILLLGIHGVILVYALVGAYQNAPPWADDVPNIASVAFVCSILWWPAFGRLRRRSHLVVVVGLVSLAALLLGPGTIFIVGLMLLNAYVVGDRLLAVVPGDLVTGQTLLAASIRVLVGACLWSVLIGLGAPLKMHYAPVYVAGLLAPIALWWPRAHALLQDLRTTLTNELPANWRQRAWIAVIATLLALHLIVVAKPDVGYDATTMHLQLPLLFSKYHQWRYDVTRYAWAVMPLGADFQYVAAYLLGGEASARLLNLCFGVTACHLAYHLARRYAGAEVALASICLLVSCPLAYLETGSLWVENLWLAFLLGSLLLALQHARTHSEASLAASALLAAGAMQCKVFAVAWVVPLAIGVAYAVWRRRDARIFSRRTVVLVLTAICIGAWPYVNAWVRTGNPVFPFLNGLFRSPFFDTTISFAKLAYDFPLSPWSIYDLFLSSNRYIEGTRGAAGFHWLLLIPLIALTLVRRRPLAQRFCLALGTIFFVAVFAQQAYLRYLLPSLLLIAILGAWALDDLLITRPRRVAFLAVGVSLCLLNLEFMFAASWWNATLCVSCAFDDKARSEYTARYMPDRIVGDYLNATLPEARIGFFEVNGSGASGYLGYSRAANWHDVPTFGALLQAKSAEDVLAIARRYHLTHAVLLEATADVKDPPVPAIALFRDKYTLPVWRYRGRLVAVITPDDG